MQSVSQYQVTKQRKELRRLETEMAKAREALASAETGKFWNRDEKRWRVNDLEAAIEDVRNWLASAVVEKAPDWSPARRARHGFPPINS